MARQVIILLSFFVAGCAAPARPVVERPDCPPCERLDVSERPTPRERPEVSVSEYALSPCDSRKAWLPEKGTIRETTWWRSKRRDEQTIDRCAERHDRLIEEVKAILGELRNE